MTQEEVIARAREAAREQGWPWHESVHAVMETKTYPEPGLVDSVLDSLGLSNRLAERKSVRKVWNVSSCWGGFSDIATVHVPCVVVVIDDESGEVLHKFYQPR